MKKSVLKTAMVAALGASAVVTTQVATAGVASFDWNGVFTMLDSGGGIIANTSNRGAAAQQTPVSGTMAFDTVTGAGTATLVPFAFFKGTSPAEAVGINMQAIGDGAGGPGTLVLGNMLFNWNGNNGIPVSLVLDAAGFFTNGATMATPASDGTYTPYGYTGIGPVPIATTAWNTTNTAACDGNPVDPGANCMGVATSGILPLVFDTVSNPSDTSPNIGGGIGGNPMQAGPFAGSNANFDVTVMTPTGYDANATLPPNCNFDPSGNCFQPPSVPVPAAVWLFGSGLLGLVGVARRKKSEV
jgi:hypothetical protein